MIAFSISFLFGILVTDSGSSFSLNATSSNKYRCGPCPSGGLGGTYTAFRRFLPTLYPLTMLLTPPTSPISSKSFGPKVVTCAGMKQYIPWTFGSPPNGASGSSHSRRNSLVKGGTVSADQPSWGKRLEPNLEYSRAKTVPVGPQSGDVIEMVGVGCLWKPADLWKRRWS